MQSRTCKTEVEPVGKTDKIQFTILFITDIVKVNFREAPHLNLHAGVTILLLVHFEQYRKKIAQLDLQ